MSSEQVRERSASPIRGEPKAKKIKSSSGFKWKEKPTRDNSTNDRDSGRLERGYRDRSPRGDSYRRRDDNRQDSYRSRDNDRSRDPGPDYSRRRYREDGQRDAEHMRKDRDHFRSGSDQQHYDRRRDPRDEETRRNNRDDGERKDGAGDGPRHEAVGKDRGAKEKKKRPPKQVAPTGPMIIVNVNDRLGTKAAIPCLASDSVKAFKAIVAAHIGRQPHEIMLKRQGERPFKDQLTLEDYGVSNGVQLDLELDTGD